MPTLGTQNIATSYSQLLKADTLNPISATLQAITSGDSSATSALALSTTEVQSTGSFTVASASRLLGSVTFGTNLTASTGTATIGTIASTTINNSGLATVGTLEIGGLAGPKITNVSYGTFAFTGATVQTHAANDTTIGTFALPCQLGDIVIASINSLGSTTGTGALIATNFFPIATDVVEYNIIGKGQTAGTIPAGTIFATAMRFTT
jgi:hypothetical protein